MNAEGDQVRATMEIDSPNLVNTLRRYKQHFERQLALLPPNQDEAYFFRAIIPEIARHLAQEEAAEAAEKAGAAAGKDFGGKGGGEKGN